MSLRALAGTDIYVPAILRSLLPGKKGYARNKFFLILQERKGFDEIHMSQVYFESMALLFFHKQCIGSHCHGGESCDHCQEPFMLS